MGPQHALGRFIHLAQDLGAMAGGVQSDFYSTYSGKQAGNM